MKRFAIVDLETGKIVVESKDLGLIKDFAKEMEDNWCLRRCRPYKITIIEYTEIPIDF